MWTSAAAVSGSVPGWAVPVTPGRVVTVAAWCDGEEHELSVMTRNRIAAPRRCIRCLLANPGARRNLALVAPLPDEDARSAAACQDRADRGCLPVSRAALARAPGSPAGSIPEPIFVDEPTAATVRSRTGNVLSDGCVVESGTHEELGARSTSRCSHRSPSPGCVPRAG